MLETFLNAYRQRQRNRRAWLIWTTSAQSRIYMPYPQAKLSLLDPTSPKYRRWISDRDRALANLRRNLPYEEFQEAWSEVESRTDQLLDDTPAAALAS